MQPEPLPPLLPTATHTTPHHTNTLHHTRRSKNKTRWRTSACLKRPAPARLSPELLDPRHGNAPAIVRCACGPGRLVTYIGAPQPGASSIAALLARGGPVWHSRGLLRTTTGGVLRGWSSWPGCSPAWSARGGGGSGRAGRGWERRRPEEARGGGPPSACTRPATAAPAILAR